MWKREADATSNNENFNETKPYENSYSRTETTTSAHSATNTASIGHTISINGKISGDEDLIIQGKVKGEIRLSKNTLSIGRNGSVDASVLAKIVKVDGEVKGDIEGSERVIINESGRVFGNIKSPRVVLKDGSRFKGNIDMQQEEVKVTNLPKSENKIETSSPAKPVNPTITQDKTDLSSKLDKKIDLRNL